MNAFFLKIFSILGTALVVGFLGFALFGSEGVAHHERLRAELAQLDALNENLGRENQRLAAQAKALRHNPRYIESVIRDELGWIKNDELVIIVPEKEK